MQNSGLTEMDFFDAVDNSYGLDDNEMNLASVPNDENSVTVPPSRFALSQQQRSVLQEAGIDPLSESNNYGIELYEAIIALLS